MKEILDVSEFSKIIQEIDEVEYIEKEHVSKLKAKIILVDSSQLYVREIRKKVDLINYSYYWLRK